MAIMDLKGGVECSSGLIDFSIPWSTCFVRRLTRYKHCRDKKEGNERFLLHSEFNEIVIDHLLNNAAWKMEKELLATGKRVSIRKLTESSDIYQNVDINFKEPHDLKLCKEVYDGTKRVEGEEEEKDGEEVEKDDSPSSWPPAAAPKSSSTSSSTSISNSS